MIAGAKTDDSRFVPGKDGRRRAPRVKLILA